MRRRALLTTAIGSIAVSGCLNSDEEQNGEGTTVEIIPNNRTDHQISLDVTVYATDGSLLLDHSYSLPAEHSDESRGVENRVDYLTVSVDDRDRLRHTYDPDIDICSRDGEDVQILVERDDITFAYSC
jgi:hypothetical protein